VLAARDDWPQSQIDGIVGRPRHNDARAAPLEEVAHLLADRKDRLRLVETRRSGGPDRRMAGVDGDGEPTQRIAPVDRGSPPNAKHEIAVLPQYEIPVEWLPQRDLELRPIIEHLLPFDRAQQRVIIRV